METFNENSKVVKWFWEILEEFNDEERIKFIKFCRAQERLPSTSEEFERLQIKFKIKPNMEKNAKNKLPKAETCFFDIELSDYTSKEKMRKMILIAITFDNGLNKDRASDERGSSGGRGGRSLRGGRDFDDGSSGFGAFAR